MQGYTEDHLIEQPAIQLMQHELGWEVANCYDEPSALPTSLKLRRPGKLRRSGWNPMYQRLIADLPAVEK